MTAIRYGNGTTNQNEQAIIEILKDKNTQKVIFFASPTTNQEESDVNLPLMSALVEYKIPGAGMTKVIYDGEFLTAARRPRYLEIKNVLDNAESSEKIYFSLKRAPFTSDMAPKEAATALESLGSQEQLTTATRAQYFSMLSNITEEDYP